MTEGIGLAGQLGGIRQLLQDMLAPGVQRLDEKVSGLAQRCSELANAVERNRSEILKLWQYVGQEFGTLRERVSRVEGIFVGRQTAPGIRPAELPPTDPQVTE